MLRAAVEEVALERLGQDPSQLGELVPGTFSRAAGGMPALSTLTTAFADRVADDTTRTQNQKAYA